MLIELCIPACIAIVATFMVITSFHVVHALLYLVVSLLSVACMFFLLGAPFAAALEVIVYAGAIMMLFVFVMMMLNLGQKEVAIEKSYLTRSVWGGPALCVAILWSELFIILYQTEGDYAISTVAPKEVSLILFGSYGLGVIMAAFLLVSGMVGAYYIGRK